MANEAEVAFEFEVRDVLEPDLGFKGDATLVGPRLSAGSKLAVGDRLDVLCVDGQSRPARCVEFPLLNLGPERVDWVRVSVVGIEAMQLQVGATASKVL